MIYTIGVYGFSREQFFQKLIENGIKTFWDIRARRGMRGPKYSFANASALEEELAALGITYRHIKQLSPSERTRDKQRAVDKESGILKTERTRLSQSFSEAFFEQFSEEDWQVLSKMANDETGSLALFCVESQPEACHRSLVAEKISGIVDQKIRHIV